MPPKAPKKMSRGHNNSIKGKYTNKEVLKRLLGYLFKYYKFYLIIIILCLIVGSVSGSASSIFLQQIINNVITPGIEQGFDAVKDTFIKLLAAMGSIYAASLIANCVYGQLSAVVTQGYLHHIRTEMFNKMESFPISYFDKNLRGDIMSTYTNDVDTLRQLVSQTIPALLQTGLLVIIVFVMMLTYSIYLTLIVVVALFFIALAAKKIGGGSAKYFLKQQRTLAEYEGYVEEMMNGVKVVKVFTHEKKSVEKFDEINDRLFDDVYKANAYANVLPPIIHNIGNILYVITAIVGCTFLIFKVNNLSLFGLSPILLGTIIAFLTASRQFANQFNQISSTINSFVMALAGANRIFTLIDEEPEKDEGYVTLVNCNVKENGEIEECANCTNHWAWKHPHKDGTLDYKELKGDIVLEHVDFGYNPDNLVLHDISIYAKPGQKIALVGATGAGKTTITNLITRFYDLADGKVRYDGININKIKKPDLRRSIGMVLQDTSLFTGTVKDNIKYGKLDATDEEVYEAAKIANAYDFITRLPNGFDTVLENDGSNLSQGQRQLISIARAAISNPPVLILDEATSSIDTHTEKLVQDGMDQLMKGRTVFVIAHRLSTIQNSDAIMVMDHGRIIERGTHEFLMSLKGTYYQLYTGAFELE